MYTQKNNNNLMFYVLVIALSVACFSPAVAQVAQEQVKEFLKESEFALQRTQTESSVVGKKGLMQEETKADISDLVTVDLIDPFENKTIQGTKTSLEPLDDGIELEVDDLAFQEELENLQISIDNYFQKIENQEDVNPVELLNNLKITRIASSPMKYVEIQGKKYSIEDIITVRVNQFAKANEFEETLSNIEINARSNEEQTMVDEIKNQALERYNTLTNNTETALNIVKVEVSDISNASVSFLIDSKTYKIVMKP